MRLVMTAKAQKSPGDSISPGLSFFRKLIILNHGLTVIDTDFVEPSLPFKTTEKVAPP